MIMAALAAVLLAVPAVQAQKVNKDAVLGKLTKSDAEIADAKKNTKAAAWLNRGKVYYEAASLPVKDVFVGMESMMLKLAVGEPKAVEAAVVNGAQYEVWQYPFFTAYVADGRVVTFANDDLYPNALAVAIDAYKKAYELDPKQVDKTKAGLKQVSDFCIQRGETANKLGQHETAAAAFEQAYEAQETPAYGEPDAMCLYNAGLLYTMSGATNPATFPKGAALLEKAIKADYADEDGNIYYYLFHCYYGQKNNDPSMVGKAKQILLDGMAKYPRNERIMEGLIGLYSAEEGVGDPKDLIEMLEKQIAANPQSVDLWFSRGRLFYSLKNYDESIASFKKVTALSPDLAEGYYLLGYLYVMKGDAMQNEMGEKNYTSQEAYDADLASVNDVYREAVAPLEKANELKAGDENTLNLLKSVCFRLRDEEGMMDKFNYYNPLWKRAAGQE